ncbi:hypothetical protein LINPERPRIM_LOCUS32463 [Linum perenne]
MIMLQSGKFCSLLPISEFKFIRLFWQGI